MKTTVTSLTCHSDVLPYRLHCGWHATNVPPVSHYWLEPVRAIPEAQPSLLAFWNIKNKVITHHLPSLAIKTTREHAVQASCSICMHDPVWKSVVIVSWTISLYSIERTSPHTFPSWLTSSCPFALKWAFPSCCHGRTGSKVKKEKHPKHLTML